MAVEEAIEIIKRELACVSRDCNIERCCANCDLVLPSREPIIEAYKMAIDALNGDKVN